MQHVLEELRDRYQSLWGQAQEGSVAERAYANSHRAMLYHRPLDAKNELHVFELGSSGEAQQIYREARLAVETVMHENNISFC